MPARYEDKDGLDAPFSKAWDAAIREDKIRQDDARRRLHDYAVFTLCLGRTTTAWERAAYDALIELHAAGLLPERLAWKAP